MRFGGFLCSFWAFRRLFVVAAALSIFSAVKAGSGRGGRTKVPRSKLNVSMSPDNGPVSSAGGEKPNIDFLTAHTWANARQILNLSTRPDSSQPRSCSDSKRATRTST